jgi:hypothetical protein
MTSIIAHHRGRQRWPAEDFTAEIDLSDAEDLSEMDVDHWDLIEAAASSQASVVILPDLSGVSDREFLVKRTGGIRWI